MLPDHNRRDEALTQVHNIYLRYFLQTIFFFLQLHPLSLSFCLAVVHFFLGSELFGGPA